MRVDYVNNQRFSYVYTNACTHANLYLSLFSSPINPLPSPQALAINYFCDWYSYAGGAISIEEISATDCAFAVRHFLHTGCLASPIACLVPTRLLATHPALYRV